MNAKELILSKINATPELADIYIYLLGIGMSFTDIAKMMTSPAFNEVTELGKKDIYDPFSATFDVKKALRWVTGTTPAFVKDNQYILGAALGCKTIEELEGLIGYPLVNYKVADARGYLTGEKIDSAIERINNAIAELNLRKHDSLDFGDDNAEEAAMAAAEGFDEVDAMDGNTVHPITTTLANSTIPKLREVVKILEFLRKKINIQDNPKSEVLRTIVDFLPGVEETSLVGQSFGINQGCKTNIHGLWAYKDRVESFVNKRYFDASASWKYEMNKDAIDEAIAANDLVRNGEVTPQAIRDAFIAIGSETDKTVIKQYYQEHFDKALANDWNFRKFVKSLGRIPWKFDFLRFLDDSDYQQRCIGFYDTVKTSHNVLEAFVTVPHFHAMMEMFGNTYKALYGTSFKFRFITDAAEAFKAQRDTVTEADFKALENFVNEKMILDFFKQSNLTFMAPAGSSVYFSSYSHPTPIAEPVKCGLSGVRGMASFKKIFDDVIVTALRNKYPNNAFLKALIPYEDERNSQKISG